MANIPRPSLEELEEYLNNYEQELSAEPDEQPTPEDQPETAEAPPAPAAKQKPGKHRNVKQKKSPLMKIWGVISTLLVIAVLLLAAALVGIRLFGYTPFAVLSPSMTPQYAPGDLIYIKETPLDQIVEGDVITFVADADSTVVTHRVVEVDRDGRKFYTQGDANANRDGNPVLYENVLGVVEFSLPKLGYVSTYVSSETGRYAAMAGVFVLILLWILPELLRPEEKKVEEKTKAE